MAGAVHATLAPLRACRSVCWLTMCLSRALPLPRSFKEYFSCCGPKLAPGGTVHSAATGHCAGCAQAQPNHSGRNEALVLRQPMGLTGQEPGAALSRLHGGGGSEVTLGGLGGENSRCSCCRGGAQRAIVCRIQNPCVLPRADMLKDPLYMPAQKPPCFRLFVYVNFSGASNYEAEQPERRARC